MKIRNFIAICGIAVGAICISTACSNNAQNKETSSAGAESSTSAENVDYGKITLGKYKGIEIEVSDGSVTDEEVESRIQSALSTNPNRVSVTGRDKVENGDLVNIDFEGKMDGNTFDGGTFNGYELTIGSGSFIDGFEEQVIGMKKGETKDINLTFPDPYPSKPEYAGKPVVFKVKVNDIYTEEPAEFNDAWVEKVTEGKQKTTDEYRATVREELKNYKEMMATNEAQIAAINKVIADSTIELSEEGINKEVETINASLEKAAASYGMDFEQFKQVTGTTDESTRERAESFAKQRLVINEIFKRENMTLEDEDYKKIEEAEGKSKNELILEEGKEAVDEYVKSVKVVNFLVDNAVKKPVSTETTAAQSESASESKADTKAESSESKKESSSN
mgnify:CR=1 FL=1